MYSFHEQGKYLKITFIVELEGYFHEQLNALTSN